MTPLNVPPLPELSDGVQYGILSPQNDWRLLVADAPLFAETPLFITGKNGIVATRSPFRSGVIRFGEDGLILEGMAMKCHPTWFTHMQLYAMVPYLFGMMINTFGKKIGMPFSIRMTCMLVVILTLLGPMLIGRRMDRNRAAAKMLLSWESFYAIQIDPNLRHLTLVDSSFSAPPSSVKGLFEFVSLSGIEPNIVHGIERTVRHFAPHVIREDITIWRAPVKTPHIIILLVIMLLSGVAVLAFVYFKRRYFP